MARAIFENHLPKDQAKVVVVDMVSSAWRYSVETYEDSSVIENKGSSEGKLDKVKEREKTRKFYEMLQKESQQAKEHPEELIP